MSYVPQTDIVSVQLMDLNNPWSFVGKPYSYYTDHRLAVGDVVTVETKLGSVLAKVVEIDVPAYRVQRFKSIMRRISRPPMPAEKVGKPRLPTVTQLKFGG